MISSVKKDSDVRRGLRRIQSPSGNADSPDRCEVMLSLGILGASVDFL